MQRNAPHPQLLNELRVLFGRLDRVPESVLAAALAAPSQPPHDSRNVVAGGLQPAPRMVRTCRTHSSRCSSMTRARATRRRGTSSWGGTRASSGRSRPISPAVRGRRGGRRAGDVAEARRPSDGLREPAALGGWLATTARRECLRVLRDAGRVVPCAEAPDADDGCRIEDRLLLKKRDTQLRRAFARLSGRDQALLRMLAADPAPSYDEIGAALGMPVGSIGPTRARALTRLRREIDRLGADTFR